MAPGQPAGKMGFAGGRESLSLSDWMFPTSDVPVESLRLRFALLQSLNTTLETFFLPLVELRQTEMYANSIAALLQEAKGQLRPARSVPGGRAGRHTEFDVLQKILARDKGEHGGRGEADSEWFQRVNEGSLAPF